MNIKDSEEAQENTFLKSTEEIEKFSEAIEDVQIIGNVEISSASLQPNPIGNNSEFIAAIAELTNQLKETNRISQERELVIDRLHRENQQLKQGELQQALLPIFRDLIRFYDDLDATITNYSNNPVIGNEKILRDLSCYKETVVDILYRYGVEPIEAKVGEDFNSKEHKAMATASTFLENQDRKIAQIFRQGFKTETKIIRNVEIEVYRYSAPIVEETVESNEKTIEGQVEEVVETTESETEVK